MRLLLRALGQGVLGLVLFLGLLEVSRRIPGSPTAQMMSLVALAAHQDAADSIGEGAAGAVFAGNHWYQSAALPALAGIVEGLVLGAFFRLGSRDAIAATVWFVALLFAFQGQLLPRDVPSWLGALFFLFCLLGGAQLARRRSRGDSLGNPPASEHPAEKPVAEDQRKKRQS